MVLITLRPYLIAKYFLSILRILQFFLLTMVLFTVTCLVGPV